MTVRIGLNDPILNIENQIHHEKLQTQLAAFRKHFPHIQTLQKSLHSLLNTKEVDEEGIKKPLDELLTEIQAAETFADDFFRNVGSLKSTPLTFNLIETALSTLRNSPLPEFIVKFITSVDELGGIKNKRFQEADKLAAQVEKSMKEIYVNFIKLNQKIRLCEQIAYCKSVLKNRIKKTPSTRSRGYLPLRSRHTQEIEASEKKGSVKGITWSGTSSRFFLKEQAWETAPVGAWSCVRFDNTILQSLHQQNGEEVRRVHMLFEEHYFSLTDVNIRLEVLCGLIREKNVKFNTRTNQHQRNWLSQFSTLYIQTFWELLREVYQMQAMAQYFSHLVQGLKCMPFILTALGREWFKKVPDKLEERMTFQKIKELRYHYVLELDKKIQKVGIAQINLLVLVIQELGRYEQTVANLGFPLNFFMHAFRPYRIRAYIVAKK